VGQLNGIHEGEENDMASMRQRIGIIGVGAVGSASLLSTVRRVI
jgi:hypothetical protein